MLIPRVTKYLPNARLDNKIIITLIGRIRLRLKVSEKIDILERLKALLAKLH